MISYLLDTNTFIEAKNRYYPFDVVPAYWEWIDKSNSVGTVFSIQPVYDELLRKSDQLEKWARKRKNDLFISMDSDDEPNLIEVSNWLRNSEYDPTAITKFLSKADYYLIVRAMTLGCTVVTHEKSENSLNRVKIPNVCEQFDVKCISLFEMLRRENARFILGS